MTDKLILGDLNAGKFENIDRFILEYLSPAEKTSNCSTEQLSRLTLTTVQVLQASVVHISSSGPHRSTLLTAIHLCYTFYVKHHNILKLPEPLTVPKVLYHIVAKLLDIKDCGPEVFKTCQYLYNELLPLPDHSTGATASIITNIYSKLWNVAIKLEQDKATQQPDVVFQLRYMAIKMLLLRRMAVGQTVDKFLLAVDRYDKSTIQKNSKTVLTSDHLSVSLVMEIAQQVKALGSDHCELSERDVCSSLSLFQYLHQLIVNYQLHSILAAVHQIRESFLSTFESVSFSHAMKNLYDFFHVTMMCSTKSKNSKTSCSDIQSLSGNIVAVLEDSVCSLNTGWYLLICECLLVILKQQTIIPPEKVTLWEEVLDYTQKVTQFLITSRDDNKLQYEEDSKDKNEKLAVMISTKLIIILRTELELGVSLANILKAPDKVTHILETIQPLAKAYTQEIEQTSHTPPPADFILRERRQCGYLMSKFAKVSCSLGHQELDLFYYSVECDQLTKWAESDHDLKEERIKEVNLLGIYEMLADLQWKLGDIDAVLCTLTRSIQLQPSYVSAALEVWCRIKREQLRSGNLEITDRCFAENLENVYDILMMELKYFTALRKRYPKAELSLLKRLQEVATLPVQKATSLLEMAKLYWGHFTENQDSCVEECLGEAERVLRGSSGGEEMLVLADVHLWIYIVQHERFCKKLISTSQVLSKGEESNPDSGEEPQPSGALVFEEMCTFSMEMEIIRRLDQALELWENVPNREHTESSLRSVMLCSSILRLAGKVDREQRTLFLALGVCSELGDEAINNIIKCRLSHIYGTHGMHHQARQLLPAIPDQQAGLDDGYLQTVMSSVMHYLHTKQVEKGLQLLTQVNETIGQQPSQSKTVCLANGTVKRCWSLFLSLPMERDPDGGQRSEDYSLDHAIEAYRNHVSVVYFLLGKEHWAFDNKGLNTTEKYDIIQEYLLSLYHLGQLERLVGDTRSAKFHIKEGWTTAHFMGLPKWASMFMNEFSIIHILSENSTAAISSLTKTCQVFNGSQDTAGENATNRSSKSRKSKTTGSFGFDDDAEEEEDGMESFQSPSPPCWQHLTDNSTCDLCQDNTVKLAVLSYALVTAKFEIYIQQNLTFEKLERINCICERFILQKPSTSKLGRDLPFCCFQDNSELKDVYVECLSLIAETSLLLGKTEKCANVIETAQKFFQSKYVSDLVANLIQNKFTVFKAQMCLMRSLSSKRFTEEEMDDLDEVTSLETSIKPENILPEISSKMEDCNDQPITTEDCHELMEDLSNLDINAMIDQSVNQSKTGTRTNRRKGTTQKRPATGNISGDVSEASSRSSTAGTEAPEESLETSEKSKRPAGRGRKENTRVKSAKSTSSKLVNSIQANSNTSFSAKTAKKEKSSVCREGRCNDGSLTEELTQTPVTEKPEFVLKTPYSVSSKKALMFSSDSSDDEVCSKLPVSISRLSSVTPGHQESSSANSTPSTGKASSVSRIPKYVNKAKFTGTRTESKKAVKQDSGTQEDKENQTTKKGVTRRGKAAVNQEPAKASSGEPVKSRERRKVTEKPNASSVNQKSAKTKDKTCVYDFDEKDLQSKEETKGVRKPTTRRNNSKRQPAEKARSAWKGERDAVGMVDVEYVNIKEEETSLLEENQYNALSIQISNPKLDDDDWYEREDLLVQEVEDLDNSIEILRGGNDKKSGRGRPGRKVTKLSNQVKGEECTGPVGGTDTTEIPRSTTQANMQITMDRMRRAAPPRRLNKDSLRADSPKEEDLTSMLEVAFEQARHLPTTGLYSSICNLLALQYLELCPLKAAYYLTEGMVVTFRHQSLVNCSRKIRKSKKEMSCQSEREEQMGAQEGEIKNTIYKNLMFNKTPQDLQNIIKHLPEDWTVCQVSMVTNPQVPDQMILSSMRRDQEPVVVRLPAFQTVHGRKILSEFSDIMEESHNSIKITDKTEWWQSRWKLDDRLRDVLEHMDKYWLGHWRCLIHGTVQRDESATSLNDFSERVCQEIYRETRTRLPLHVVQRLVECADTLSDEDIRSAICELTGNTLSRSGADNCVSTFRRVTKDMTLTSPKGHVLLILDKAVQHLPWECVPSLTQSSISRMPSLYHLHAQLSYLTKQKSSILHTGIDKQRVFYVLNPDSNLASTQDTFQDWFSREKSWEGIINRKPTKSEYTSALQNKDLFLYCGHGTGGAYLGGSDLASLDCRAATILMGCSSGKLEATGHLEATGFMLNYFMAGCPCMVANLWDVTDKDIDRFMACLLSSWLSDDTTTEPRKLLDVVPKARAACRLPHLIGAAPVVYGFPVFLKPS